MICLPLCHQNQLICVMSSSTILALMLKVFPMQSHGGMNIILPTLIYHGWRWTTLPFPVSFFNWTLQTPTLILQVDNNSHISQYWTAIQPRTSLTLTCSLVHICTVNTCITVPQFLEQTQPGQDWWCRQCQPFAWHWWWWRGARSWVGLGYHWVANIHHVVDLPYSICNLRVHPWWVVPRVLVLLPTDKPIPLLWVRVDLGVGVQVDLLILWGSPVRIPTWAHSVN